MRWQEGELVHVNIDGIDLGQHHFGLIDSREHFEFEFEFRYEHEHEHEHEHEFEYEHEFDEHRLDDEFDGHNFNLDFIDRHLDGLDWDADVHQHERKYRLGRRALEHHRHRRQWLPWLR
jgi:hypothetical protein